VDNQDTFDALFNLYQKGSMGLETILEILGIEFEEARELLGRVLGARLKIDPERVHLIREPFWSWRENRSASRFWVEIQGMTKSEYPVMRDLLYSAVRCYLMPPDRGWLREPSPPNHLRRWKLDDPVYELWERRVWRIVELTKTPEGRRKLAAHMASPGRCGGWDRESTSDVS
jgi:hypothetical protein